MLDFHFLVVGVVASVVQSYGCGVCVLDDQWLFIVEVCGQLVGFGLEMVDVHGFSDEVGIFWKISLPTKWFMGVGSTLPGIWGSALITEKVVSESGTLWG